MLRLASDADVHGEILRGLIRREPDVDLLRSQDVLPDGLADADVLAWAAAENRVLLTNDRNTMIGIAIERLTAGNPLPGAAIDDILVIAECMPEDEIRDQIVYLPL